MKGKLGRKQCGRNTASQCREYPSLQDTGCGPPHVLAFLFEKTSLRLLVSTYLQILTVSPLSLLVMGKGRGNPPSSICSLSAVVEASCPS